MRIHHRYALWGFLLGLGAPLGSLAWRVLTASYGPPAGVMAHEWQSAAYYYVYMTVGTVTAFSLFGLLLGRKNENLSDLSITDGLTAVYNHRYLQEQLSREIERSDRYATPLTCLMLDIDDFKKINDRHGHPFGDTVLVDTARILRETVRRTDIVGRYGGEEFLVLMPQTTTDAAYPIAERIVSAIRETAFVFKGIIAVHVTVSLGLATYPFPEHGIKNKSSFLSAADQSLYKAKRTGKNRVAIWKP